MKRPAVSRLGLLMAGSLVAACGEEAAPPAPPPPEVTVVTVEQRDVPLYAELIGQTKGSKNVDIRARVSGYLLAVHFQEGEPVEEGQLLYEIDPRPFEAALARAKGDVALAQADVGRAKQDVSRLEPLVAENAVPRQDYETAVSLLKAAEARLESARALEQTAQIDLDFTRIHSPMTGLAGENNISAGNLVAPGETVLTTISVIDPINARFSLSEQEYLKLVRARIAGDLPDKDSEERTFEIVLADGSVHPDRGKFVYADRSVDARTGTLNMEAEFPNPDSVLRPGQFARVRVQLDVRKGGLLVPQRAVKEFQATFQVAVVQSGDQVEMRTIEPGPRIDSMWLVNEGLKAGERVVLEGLQKVRTGMTVRPTEATAEAAAADEEAAAAPDDGPMDEPADG
jgi:membrane fusion protein (multidrug efflux system)